MDEFSQFLLSASAPAWTGISRRDRRNSRSAIFGSESMSRYLFISLFIYTRPCFLQKSTDLVDCLSTERIQDLVSAKDVLARAVRVSEAPRSESLLDGQGPAENFEELLSAKELCSAQRLTSRDFQSRQAVLEKRTQRPAWAALTSRSATR